MSSAPPHFRVHVLTFEEFCTHYPNLVGKGSTRDRVACMFKSINANLLRWERTLADGPQPGIRPGQFRHTQAGQLLRARQAASAGDTTVPAWVCEVEPQTGAIRVAHVTFTGTGSRDSRLYPCLWNQTRIWDPGD
jgi:hypothetical protein